MSARVAALAVLAVVSLAALVPGASAERPSVINAPKVTGIFMEGETLEAHGGTWTGEPPFSFTYDWQRCNNGGGDCYLIGVPQSKFYTLTAADIGFRIRAWVTVTGQDCGEWGSLGTRQCAPATSDGPSEQTPVIVAHPRFLPHNTTPPAVSGTAEEAETLRANDGVWAGLEPVVILRQWERCSSAGDACDPVANAVDETYTLTARDVGRTIRFSVIGKNVRGLSAPVPSPTTPVVVALRPRPGRTTLDVAKVVPPYRLVIDRVGFDPVPVRARVPVTARFRVSDTRGFRVRGAVVRAVGVRAGLIEPVRDARTGSDGWATLRLRPTARVAFRRGASIGVLVRAFKEGEGLGGVSARRRASLPLGAPRG
jgi:hypothetical protein